MRKGYLLLGLFILLIFADSIIAADVKYGRYINVRFAYGISYPEGMLIPQGEADNGDGQKFISKDGQVEMLAYGYNNPDEETLESVFKEASRSHTKNNPEREITYKIKKNIWFVVSGTDKGKIFYKKVIYDVKDGQFINFEILYPKSLRTSYDSITGYIAKSMKMLPGPFTEEEMKKMK